MKSCKKVAFKYYCEKCDYGCKNRYNFNKHLSTTKHKMITNDNKMIKKSCFKCACGKSYKFSSGLSRHLKVCTYSVEKCQPVAESPLSKDDLIAELLKENNELLKKQIEQGKTHITNNKTINNNQKININVFLNEHCKNAMNLTDFIENLQLTLQDAINTKNQGFIEGVSNIFIKNLNDMEPTQRPIHCADKKRLQFYTKSEQGWEIDASNHKVDKAIADVQRKQIEKIKEWEANNPDFLQNDQKMKEWQIMVHKLSGPSTDIEIEKDRKKIKKKLGQEVGIKDAISTIEIK